MPKMQIRVIYCPRFRSLSLLPQEAPYRGGPPATACEDPRSMHDLGGLLRVVGTSPKPCTLPQTMQILAAVLTPGQRRLLWATKRRAQSTATYIVAFNEVLHAVKRLVWPVAELQHRSLHDVDLLGRRGLVVLVACANHHTNNVTASMPPRQLQRATNDITLSRPEPYSIKAGCAAALSCCLQRIANKTHWYLRRTVVCVPYCAVHTQVLLTQEFCVHLQHHVSKVHGPVHRLLVAFGHKLCEQRKFSRSHTGQCRKTKST